MLVRASWKLAACISGGTGVSSSSRIKLVYGVVRLGLCMGSGGGRGFIAI